MALLYVYVFERKDEQTKQFEEVYFYAPDLDNAKEQYRQAYDTTVEPKLVRRTTW